MKRCWKCEYEKAESEFGIDRSRHDGLNPVCKECKRIISKKFYAQDPARSNAYTKKCVERNPAKRQNYNIAYKSANKSKAAENKKAWLNKNKDRDRLRQSAYIKANRHKYNAHAMKRHAQKLNATPAWADMEMIYREYELAAWCTDVMGVPYEVDHIIPLQGKYVCGLHVEYNLQVIPQSENRRKNNHFEIT